MSKKAVVISLNFNPGHVSHLIASYKQFREIGYEPYYYVHPQFLEFIPCVSRNVLKNSDLKWGGVEVALFLFPSLGNVRLLNRLKRQGVKILYVFHEPLLPLKEYKKAGFSNSYLFKLWVADHVSAFTVKQCDYVLLPSNKACEYYRSNKRYKNSAIQYLPLMFDDERNCVTQSRQYFSYIGTIAPDHSFDQYIKFVEWAIRENRLPSLKFLIASKSAYEPSDIVQNSDRVKIVVGRPLTNEEINEAYATSWCIWNAYDRTTQSGVLAKSFMFGTPAIVLRKNLNEFMQPDADVVAIEDNEDCAVLCDAVSKIVSEFDKFSANARQRFEQSFYYRNYNVQVSELLKRME